MSKIDEIIRSIDPKAINNYMHLDNWTSDDVEYCMKTYAVWYAKRCLEEADNLFDWDHDFEEWTGEYKPSEISLPEHE